MMLSYLVTLSLLLKYVILFNERMLMTGFLINSHIKQNHFPHRPSTSGWYTAADSQIKINSIVADSACYILRV